MIKIILMMMNSGIIESNERGISNLSFVYLLYIYIDTNTEKILNSARIY